MAGWKGSIVDHVRSEIRRQNLEPDLLKQLDTEAVEIYKKALPVSWVPADKAAGIIDAAAALLFPGDPQGRIKLGAATAKKHFGGGIYKIFLKIVSVETLVKKTAKIWDTFHQKGRAETIQTPGKNEIALVVCGYPDLPESVRYGVGGYSLGLLELTSAKNIKLAMDFSDPEAWKWTCTWE